MFMEGFCKVEFLCYAGELNWLGWMVLGIGLVLILLALPLLGLVFEYLKNFLNENFWKRL